MEYEAVFSTLWSYSLIQIVASVMWNSILELIAHVYFDIGIVMASFRTYSYNDDRAKSLNL